MCAEWWMVSAAANGNRSCVGAAIGPLGGVCAVPYLRLHSAVESAAGPMRLSTGRPGLPGRDEPVRTRLDSTPLSLPDLDGGEGGDPDAGEAITEIERAIDVVDHRLANLRALVDQFGLGDDDGPRAA